MEHVSIDDDLARRYGAPSPGRRRAWQVSIAVVGLLFLSWVGWAAANYGRPEVTSQVRAYQIMDEHTATVTLRVRLYADATATCKVRAIAADHNVVGEKIVEIEPGSGDERRDVKVEVRTERRATTVDKVGCTTPNQLRPR